MPHRLRSSIALFSLLLAAACGPRDSVSLPEDAGAPPEPAVTSISPDPGLFNGSVQVTLVTDRPATIFVTTDGSDPSIEGPERQSGEGTLTLELTRTTTLTFTSVTPDGAHESLRTAQFLRAGGPKGTVSGVVVVDTVDLGHAVALFDGFTPTDLGTATSARQELPFTLTGVTDGQHRLLAMADRNGDGNFVPLIDDASQPFDFTLDSTDPFKASVENVRLYLGAASPGTCIIQGTLHHPSPLSGETLRVSALSPSAFGKGADPQALLSQFQNGSLLFADPAKTDYPYALTGLQPGSYVVVPTLTTLGNGGLGMDVLANPLRMVSCSEGQISTADFDYGPLQLSGTITLHPATAPTQGFVYGVVAARNASLTGGVQALLMPVVFGQASGSGELTGGYAGRGVRTNASFALRVFTNLDSQNPIADALSWTVNVFGGQPPQATVQTQAADARADLTVPLP